ncbi:MAG: hypothetical protein ACPG77_02355 [Nannocystaceae bacterium]
MNDHAFHHVLARFPWRRRRPRSRTGHPPLAYCNRDGKTVWGGLDDLAQFEDPGPALAYAVLHGNGSGQALLASLVRHHASGVQWPKRIPRATERGLPVLRELVSKAGFDPSTKIGQHTIGSLLEATYALGVACEAS